jgi:hypothetical protein
MANAGKILGITAIIGAVAALSYKGVSFVNKLKQASGNINFDVAFLRVHGLIGEGIAKFTSPTIRTLFNLNLSNFSGFDIEVTKIFARVETNKAGTQDWSAIATTSNYITIKITDGKVINQTLTIDFKGLGTITSLINKANRHRIVLTYNYKGQQLQFIKDVDLTSPINAFWKKAQGQFNSLKGTETNVATLIS